MSVATYIVIFIALLVLLFISVGVAYVHSQTASVRTALTVVGFSIAGLKAILIMLYFMHVKFSSRLTWIFASGSFFFLLIMIWLTLNDYGTREQVYGSELSEIRIVEPGGRAEEEGPTAEPRQHSLAEHHAEQPTPDIRLWWIASGCSLPRGVSLIFAACSITFCNSARPPHPREADVIPKFWVCWRREYRRNLRSF